MKLSVLAVGMLAVALFACGGGEEIDNQMQVGETDAMPGENDSGNILDSLLGAGGSGGTGGASVDIDDVFPGMPDAGAGGVGGMMGSGGRSVDAGVPKDAQLSDPQKSELDRLIKIPSGVFFVVANPEVTKFRVGYTRKVLPINKSCRDAPYNDIGITCVAWIDGLWEYWHTVTKHVVVTPLVVARPAVLADLTAEAVSTKYRNPNSVPVLLTEWATKQADLKAAVDAVNATTDYPSQFCD